MKGAIHVWRWSGVDVWKWECENLRNATMRKRMFWVHDVEHWFYPESGWSCSELNPKAQTFWLLFAPRSAAQHSLVRFGSSCFFGEEIMGLRPIDWIIESFVGPAPQILGSPPYPLDWLPSLGFSFGLRPLYLNPLSPLIQVLHYYCFLFQFSS